MLTSLAPELIQEIGERVNVSDVAALRLTCKLLAETLAYQILRTLTIDFHKHKFQADISKLRVLASGSHAACQGTQELIVKSLSPGYDQDYRGPAWKYVENEWSQEPEPEEPAEVVLATNEVEQILTNAITSLKGVKVIHWTPVRKDPESIQKSFLNAVLALPNLNGFHVSLGSCSVAIPFDSFPPMCELSVIGFQDTQEGVIGLSILSHISNLIARSPHLSHLAIEGYWSYNHGTQPKQSLHYLLRSLPQNSKPLPIHTLSLKELYVRLDNTNIHHFRNLTKLTLVRVKDPYYVRGNNWSDDRALSTEEQAEITEDLLKYGSSVNDFWATLTTENIHLREITTEECTWEFLTYLESYSGIKRLALSASGFPNAEPSDEAAERFYTRSLQTHVQSIEHLAVTPPYEGRWCFNSHSMPVIAQCTHLKTLQMAIESANLYKEKNKQGDSSESNIISLLLNTVVAHLSDLKTLQVQAADLEGLRYAMCGNPSMAHYGRTAKKMYECAQDYQAPPGCERLPSLKIGTRHSFSPIRVKVDPPPTTKLQRLRSWRRPAHDVYTWAYEADKPYERGSFGDWD